MDPNYIYEGIVSATFRIASTDTAQTFSDAQRYSNGVPAIAAIITGETQNIRYCLGNAVPTQGANGLGHTLVALTGIRLANPQQIATFSFISAVGQTHGAIQVTMEFEPGTDLT